MPAPLNPFTPITDGTDLQDKKIINEIILALYERRKAYDEYPPPPAPDSIPSGYKSAAYYREAGDSLQSQGLWWELQVYLSGRIGYFIDDLQPIAPGNTSFKYLDFKTLCDPSHANICDPANPTTRYGFRRVPYGNAWPTDWTDYGDAQYKYWSEPPGTGGNVQTDDILGPWLFVDLQRALSAMKWTAFAGDWNSNEPLSWWIQTSASSSPICSTALTNHDNSWSDPSSKDIPGYHYEVVAKGTKVSGSYAFYSVRYAFGRPWLYQPPTFRKSAYSLYVIPEPVQFFDTFKDIDSWTPPLVQGQIYKLEDNPVVSDAAPRNSPNTFGNYNGAPVEAAGLGCSPDVLGQYSVAFSDTYWILKWEFANA